jgi:hypothetical protein
MGPTALLHSEGSRATDFIALKNLSPSAMSEVPNLGSNGKDAHHSTTENY